MPTDLRIGASRVAAKRGLALPLHTLPAPRVNVRATDQGQVIEPAPDTEQSGAGFREAYLRAFGNRAGNPMTRAPTRSRAFPDVGRRTGAASLVGALVMPVTVYAICTAAGRQAPPRASATATGGVGSIRSSRRRSGDASAP
jgi:hypothetical protein